MAAAYVHVNFEEVREFLCWSKYPNRIGYDCGKKKNFRRQASSFVLENGMLFKQCDGDERAKARVIEKEDERQTIIQAVHEGRKDSLQSRALGAHTGQDKTYEKLKERFWWPGLREDVWTYVKTCIRCQRQATRFPKAGDTLHPIEVPPGPWKQIGVDICSMPVSTEGYTCMMVAVDYFSKWIESQPLMSKSAQNVAVFLYCLVCHHGCADVQINDRGREFVNELATHLHTLTGVKQKLSSAYHPQSNGLVERNNRSLQDLLLKLLYDNADEKSGIADLPKALPAVLFSLRTSKQASTGYTPFFLKYRRQAKLPVDCMVADADEPAFTGA